MSRTILSVWLLGMFTFATCPPAWGQTMDLAQAYATALAHDASLRASRAAADAGREALPQARSRLLPALSADVSSSKSQFTTTGPGFAGVPETTREGYIAGYAGLTLRQTLYRPEQLANLRQARTRVDESEASLEHDLQSLTVRVSEAYFELLLAGDQTDLVLAQKAAFTTQLDAATKALAAGSGTRTDIDEVRARLDLSSAEELQARQHVVLAQRQLQAMVVVPFTGVARLEVAALQLRAPEPGQVEAWIAMADRSNPEIRGLQAQREGAQYEIDKARAGHLPTLDLVGEWSRSKSDNINRIGSRYTTKSLGLQLNIPLFSGGGIESGVRQAVATEVRAAELLEALRQDLGIRVYREFAGVSEGMLRIRALEQAVRSSDQVVLSNRKAFAAGSRTTVDILNAEQQRVSALRDLAQARYVYLMSRVRLEVLAGVFDAQRLRELNTFFIAGVPSAVVQPVPR